MNKEMLSEVVDYNDGLRRFSGNEALFHKFLLKFLNDENFTQMKAAIEKEDYVQAFKSGHALKGVAGNLSLEPLFQATNELVNLLRATRYDENIIPSLEIVTREYNRTVEVIKSAT